MFYLINADNAREVMETMLDLIGTKAFVAIPRTTPHMCHVSSYILRHFSRAHHFVYDHIATPINITEANSTYSDTLTYSQAVWIVMLILVICAFLACAVIAGFRFIQKCITNYKLNEGMQMRTAPFADTHLTNPPLDSTPHTASSYQKTMRFFQAFGFLGALFVMALVAWVALVLGLVGTWYARTEVMLWGDLVNTVAT